MFPIKSTKFYSNYKIPFYIWILNSVMLLPLWVFHGQNFSIDSYGILLDKSTHIEAFIGSYRWFGAFVYELFTLNGHNPILNSNMDIILFIILVSVMTTALTIHIVELIPTKNAFTYLYIDLSVLISVMNVWFCNILSFPECIFITAIGVALCFLAIITFVHAHTITGYTLSSLLLIFSTGVYQQFICVYTIFIIGICSLKIKNQKDTSFKSLFAFYLKPALLILISGFSYLTIGKCIQVIFNIEGNSRIALSLSTIVHNIFYFITNQHSYLKGRGFFESELLTICFLSLGCLWFGCIVYRWRKKQLSTITTLFLCISFGLAYFAAYIPGILSTSHAARAMFALFSIFALFTIGIESFDPHKYLKYLILLVLSITLIANTYKVVDCQLNLREQNFLDKTWSMNVITAIEEYETQNNIQITDIYYDYDEDFDMKPDGLSNSESAVFAKYSLRSMINYYSNRNFNFIPLSTTDKADFFDTKNWTSFSKTEQLIFIDNALYLCCY